MSDEPSAEAIRLASMVLAGQQRNFTQLRLVFLMLWVCTLSNILVAAVLLFGMLMH